MKKGLAFFIIVVVVAIGGLGTSYFLGEHPEGDVYKEMGATARFFYEQKKDVEAFTYAAFCYQNAPKYEGWDAPDGPAGACKEVLKDLLRDRDIHMNLMGTNVECRVVEHEFARDGKRLECRKFNVGAPYKDKLGAMESPPESE